MILIYIYIVVVVCYIIYSIKTTLAHLHHSSKKCSLDLIKDRYSNHPDYVYKKCVNVINNNYNSEREWFVVMKKLKTTITNEDRKNVFDENFAKFRANKLKVIEIINVKNPNVTRKKIINEYGGIEKSYTVGSIVSEKKYDMDINNVCSTGIHYFKTIDAAYFYSEIPKFYKGIATKWHDDGKKREEGPILNEKKSGKWTYWQQNGKISEEGQYIKGKKSGVWVFYDGLGNKYQKCNYANGKKTGDWVYYNGLGNKYQKCNYAN